MTTIIDQIIKTDGLPSPPGVAMRLLQLYNKDDVDISEIATVISTDPVLASKLINYCNSPLLARTRLTSSVEQAVVAIGIRAVKMIGLSFSLMQATSQQSGSRFDYQKFWSESLATALAARSITGHLNGDKQTFFLLGLVVNIGQLALAHAFPREYVDVIETSKRDNVPLAQLEIERWKIDRYALGGHLLRHWKFPPSMVDAIMQQGQPELCEDEANRVLEVSQHLAELLFVENLEQDRVEFIKQNAIEKLRFTDTEFHGLYDEFALYWNEHASILNFDAAQATTFSELENQARRVVAEMALNVHADHTRIMEENLQLQANVFVDGLTGLKNRRAYDKEATSELERCQRSRSTFVMMVIDLDHFKSVNDQWGHDAGDEVLIQVARTLESCMRKYDAAFRFGGEEFVIVLVDCNPKAARAAAERFRAGIENMSVVFDGQTIKVTASIGVSCCSSSSWTLEDVFKEADGLLYAGKSGGRNRCCFLGDDVPTKPVAQTAADVPQKHNEELPPLDLRACLGLKK